MAARPRPTTADYSTIAISPAFIMVLVGSLAFFLLLVFYAGDFDARIRWIMGCFVFAAVLISRVSIEEGAERAALLGVALAVAVALALMRFTTYPYGAWLVLAVVWWCASNLVWNCTLVDDDEDASGEGLLEAAGLDSSLEVSTEGQPSTAPQPAASESSASASQSTWSRLWDLWRGERSRTAPPGLWVVYFSLAALPIFGVGQHFIATDQRQYAFRLVLYYVVGALGLLITTSFLGLRRYLRQRGLEMPGEMAGMWLTIGGVMALAILFFAVLIPRPNPEYAISSLSGLLRSPDRTASRRAAMDDSATKGESQSSAANEKNRDEAQGAAAGNESPKNGETGADGEPTAQSQQGKPGDRPANDQQASSDKQDSREQGDRDKSDAKNGKTPADRKSSAGSGSKSANTSAKPTPQPHQQSQRSWLRFPNLSLGGWLLTIMKLILYLTALYFLIRYWSAVRGWLVRLWQEFKELWNSLFGKRRTIQQSEAVEEALRPRLRPFASFRDPFASGEAARQSANRTVQYSFEALEAWAAERGWPRQEEETPLEFAGRLASESPELAGDVRMLAGLYARVAYARETLASGQLSSVERLWTEMRRVPSMPVAAGARAT